MFVTEEQAVGKWCPHARQLDFHKNAGNINTLISGYNRVDGGNIPSCIASSCMSWRWSTPKQLRDIDLVTSEVEETGPRRGYCGLSGKPEYGD